MKSLSIFLILLLAVPAFSCDEPASERFIYNMLHFKRGTSDWKAVKGKTHEGNRSWKVFLHIGKGLSDSYAIYKGEKHTLDDDTVEFCKIASNQMRMTHAEHGSAVLIRTGAGDESILKGRKGIFSLRFRPAHVVED